MSVWWQMAGNVSEWPATSIFTVGE